LGYTEPIFLELIFTEARGPNVLGISDTLLAGKSPLLSREKVTFTEFDVAPEDEQLPVSVTVAPKEDDNTIVEISTSSSMNGRIF
jgi:hypothetical protein